MGWELFISWRYFMAKRREKFISLVSLIAILGIALGVMALIVVIAVMNGFDKELREKIVGMNPHIYIEKAEGIENAGELLAGLEEIDHVSGSGAFIDGQALFKAGEQITGVLLRAVYPAQKVIAIEKYIIAGGPPADEQGIVIGKELASRFYLQTGDKVSVISPVKGKSYDFTVCGIFSCGMYEYDANLVWTNIPAAQKIFELGETVRAAAVSLDNIYKAGDVRGDIQKKLGYAYQVRDWMSLNKNLFSALQLEKTVMFVIVALIVVVACFNIAGVLIMLVMEKNKDIGILKAIGVTNGAIRRIFTFEGAIIGGIGTLLGGAAGILLCYLLKTYKFIKLPDFYYVDRLPVQMCWSDSLIILSGALLISLAAAVYPAHQAAKLIPAETLRYE